MIPGHVVEALRGVGVMWVGTRNAQLRPSSTPVSWVIVRDGDPTVTIFTSLGGSKRIVADAGDNGRIAFGLALPSHEAYQLKGSYVSSRGATHEEYAAIEAHRAKQRAAYVQMMPEEMVDGILRGLAFRPGVAIDFRVEEVYLQTPGPGAGSRIEA